MSATNILTQVPSQKQAGTLNTIEFILPNGVHKDVETGEWKVWINGEVEAWANSEQQALRSYHELLDLDIRHAQRNGANVILVSNSDGETETWYSCPDCGRVLDAGEVCECQEIPFNGEPCYVEALAESDQYGLEARG